MRLIDPEMQEILRDMVRPEIEAARLSREAIAAKPIVKKADTPIVQRTRCDEHREISFTLSTGQALSACSATDCWWSADPSAHEDERYRKTHSDGKRKHDDTMPYVVEGEDSEQVIEVEELFVGPPARVALEDIDEPELDGEITEGIVSDEIEVEEELETARFGSLRTNADCLTAARVPR